MSTNWISLLHGASLLAIYALISCTGLYMMKSSSVIKSGIFLLGFIFYCTGAVIWMVILRLMPLSLAFPIAAGTLVIGTTITGIFLLNETVTVWQIAGSVLIMTGIALSAIGR